MAALIPETGAGVTAANSYCTVEYADAYFESHPYYADSWDDLEPGVKRRMLVAATRQLDVLYDWAGIPATTRQGLGWPRSGVVTAGGGYVSPLTVPERLRQATCEQAYQLSRGDPTAGASAAEGLQRVKIDVIELEFTEATAVSSAPAASATVQQLLRGLGAYAVGLRVRKVLVG